MDHGRFRMEFSYEGEVPDYDCVVIMSERTKKFLSILFGVDVVDAMSFCVGHNKTKQCPIVVDDDLDFLEYAFLKKI